MSWTRPAISFAQGAAITLGSTAVSCALALQVERSAHRLFFWAAPHWYARVDQAHGLSEEDLQYARQVGAVREIKQVGNLVHHVCFMEQAAIAAANKDNDDRSNHSFWNQVRIPSDEERILDSAPL